MAALIPVSTGEPERDTTHYVQAILGSLWLRGDDTALRWRGTSVSARGFHRDIGLAAEGLRRLGVGPGTTVGVLTEANSPLALTARYAAHLLGATAVYVRSTNPGPGAPALPAADQAEILRETGADLLVVDPANARTGQAAANLLSPPVRLAGFGECGAGIPALTAADVPMGRPAPAHEPDTAVVTYTSGSTGRPKGIRQSFTGWNSTVLSAHPALRNAGKVTFLVVTPVSHAVGVILDIVLAAGGTVVLHERFEPGQALGAIEAERITGTYMAVPQLYALLDHHALADTDVSSLRQLMYGGCPASPERLAQAVRFFGDALMQNYGTSEGGRITLLGPRDHRSPELLSTVGRPFPEVDLSVRDPETERELPPGRTGEVWMKSPNMMSGYVGDPALTARTLRHGWLRTGDLGHLDAKGYLHLTGRLSDVIKSRATKIHPATVEKALASHEGVANAVVYGVRDSDELEHVHADVALRRGATCTAEQLRRHVAAALTPLHVPARITFHTELPLAVSGKVDRRQLRSLAERSAAPDAD
ncbi:class I adenylate-forming enzyme family protein [Streptomyces sp. NPDC094038]|uniref:class I adenylate-forming enzyme family protein n=1 Tax=Streptomyces sp. NPDC094038 TaxID=3366055 RepID=UPI00380F351D